MFFLLLFAPLSWFQKCGSGKGGEHNGANVPRLIRSVNEVNLYEKSHARVKPIRSEAPADSKSLAYDAPSPCRLDVHEHVCDAGVALLNRTFYSVRDLVPFVHGNVSVDTDV